MSELPPMSPELERLLGEFDGGAMDAAAWAELSEVLRRDAGAQEQYLHHMALHARLLFQARAMPEVAGRVPPRRRRWRHAAMAVRYAAAVALVVGFVAALSWVVQNVRHPAASSPRVATLVDATDAVWAGGDARPEVGGGLRGGWLTLESGTARIEFLSGATVTIKGPATLGLNSTRRAFLRSGLLEAHVPPRARGFTVGAPGCAVVDLGTVFSLHVEARQSVVQVLKGQVRLDLLDTAGRVVQSEHVPQHRALKIDPRTLSITPHGFEADPFNPSAQLVLELADIVAGGDGMGGGSGRGIDPRNGAGVTRLSAVKSGVVEPGYHRGGISPLVDGVFVPAGGPGVQVDSRGDQFDGLPRTDRSVIGAIWSAHRQPGAENRWDWLGQAGDVTHLAPQGHGVVAMHTNAGFTLDLAAARAAHPGWAPAALRGVAVNVAPREHLQRAEFWVLLDGRLARRITLDSRAPSRPFGVPIDGSPRFLTLIFTDGHDTFDHDWTILADTVLQMQPDTPLQGEQE